MSETKDRERSFFNAARQLPTPQARAAFLREACAGDDQLRQRVEALLQAAQSTSDFLEQPSAPSLANQGPRATPDATGLPLGQGASPPPAAGPTIQLSVPLTEKPGDRIGHYKLLQQIGEGGCGVVYLAEQEEPIRRRVALKVIKLGMDTKQVIARFEAERQALALMDHPNIAKVLDAGATDTGRPYFVMELVRGIRITDYCDQNHLPTEARLDLFIQVCHAIQHAHQKGLIHRDIKPSNILVTVNDGVAVPKVIDFGIAKATEQRLTDKTLFTVFEQFIGTPAYMSPEQAEMTSLDIDTRSDIYALGVLLYELLTGQTPFDAKALIAAGLDEMRRIIREQEPVRPSTRLSSLDDAEQTTVAKRRHAEPPKLIHQVRGDLDWIVMKCLEKDRTRRYETANGLADDIERHSINEPVLARPPSSFYRFEKLVRRHKLAFAAMSAVLVSLLLGLGAATVMFLREREARIQAQVARQNEAQARQAARVADETVQVYQSLEVDLPGLKTEAARRSQLRKEEEALNMGRIATISDEALTHSGCVNPAAPEFAVIMQDGALRIFDAQGKVGKVFRQPGQNVTAVAFSPNGTELLAGTRTGALLVWDAARGTCSAVTNVGRKVDRVTWLGNDRLVWGGYVEYWKDGKPANHDKPAGAVLNRVSGQLQWTFCGFVQADYYTLAGAMNSQQLVVMEIPGQPRGAFLLDGVTGKMLHTCYDKEHGSGPLSVGISPDGNILAVGYAPYDIVLWNARTGERQNLLKGHSNWVVSLAFSADNKRLISGAGDSTARLWEVETGTEIGRLRFDAESSYVCSVGLSPRGDLAFALTKGELVVAKTPQEQK